MVPGSIPGVRVFFCFLKVFVFFVGAFCNNLLYSHFRDSIVVSISACHADDPGSIPGRGVLILIVLLAVATSFI